MGQYLSQPNSQITDPNTGQSSIGDPNKVLAAAGKALPGIYQQRQIADATGQPSNAAPPDIGTPSFTQAATAGALPGSGNVASPGLNKAGKLAVLLTSGLQGALAGRAASEQAVLQSGGHRSGGAGIGFEAGLTAPWQRAGMQADIAQKQAQTALTQQQGTMVQTPGGPMPLALAKVFYPAELRAAASEANTAATVAGRQNTANTAASARTGSATILGNARIEATRLGLGPIAQVPQDLQEQFGLPAELPLRMLNQAETAANKPLTIIQGENGPSIVNKQQAAKGVGGAPKNLGVGSPRLGGAVQIGDPNNPGNTTFSTAGQAIRSGSAGTQSSSVQVPKAAALSEVPTQIGNQRISFTTMIQHADLLRDAAKALNNGDVQTLAGLKNAFKNEFGYSGPITAKAIAHAYGGEVTNVISKGYITDAEMTKTGKTLDPSKQNFQTINNVLNAYQALAQSKMNMLDKQEQSAIKKSQPNGKKNPSSDLVNQLIQKHAPTAASATQ